MSEARTPWGKLHGPRAAELDGRVRRYKIDTHHEHIGDFQKQGRRRACVRRLWAEGFATMRRRLAMGRSR
ncbi:MAG: hypothetical protein M3N02_00195 [Pseudomonadota bacterium]|nr:hypothetical protein [Pseudomonadota bacterium]